MADVTQTEMDRKVQESIQVYDTSFLNGYDLWVHGFCNKYAWYCPTERLIAQYKSLTSSNHLEVGVGTGFLINRLAPNIEGQRLSIMDLSENCLEYSERRLIRYRPERLRHDILKEYPANTTGAFDSIGINYVLHCVPGSFRSKGVAFKNLKALLNPKGVLFGSTLLGAEVSRSLVARTLMFGYQKVGIFSNKSDTESELRAALAAHFAHVHIQIVGCCALFEARQ